MAFLDRIAGGLLGDVIRCDEPSYLIWKWHPQGTIQGQNKRENSIRYGSSLRVKDGEVAVFVYKQDNGVLQDFIEGPYDYTITTQNFPVLAGILGLGFQGSSPFQAEVYFINMAKVIQIPFGVPYFDIFDSRFTDMGVPTAVRGRITFQIANCVDFIKLHRLASFDLQQFQTQIRDAVIMYVKGIVAKIPMETKNSVLQIEQQIDVVQERVEKVLQERCLRDFGVNITAVDISAIEILKDSDGYRRLLSVTSDLQIQRERARTEIGIQRMRDNQRADVVESLVRLNDQKERPWAEKPQNSLMVSQTGNHSVAGEVMRNTVPNSYYVALGKQPKGPYDFETLKTMKLQGLFAGNSLVWKKGMAGWVRADSVAELEILFLNIPEIPDEEM